MLAKTASIPGPAKIFILLAFFTFCDTTLTSVSDFLPEHLTLWESQNGVSGREGAPPYGGCGHVEVVVIVRVQRSNMEVSIHSKEGPLSSRVSLHGFHSVVAEGSIQITWRGRGPEQHDEGGA